MAFVSRELRAYLRLPKESVRSYTQKCYRGVVLADVPIANKDNKGHAVTKFMRTRRWTGSIGTRQLIQKPV